MFEKNSFYEDDELNQAAVILSTYSPDVVANISNLVRKEGSNLIPMLFTSAKAKASSHSRPFAIASKDYIPPAAFENFWRGLCLLFMGVMRKPDLGEKEWADAFQHGYSLPSGLAANLGKRVDTEDILKPAGIVTGKEQEGFMQEIFDLGNTIKEGARSVVNALAKDVGLPWAWEQNQKYDIDRTYEITQAGVVVRELDLRASMINGQLAVARDWGMMQSGDAEYGDTEKVLSQLGDACYEIGKPMLPQQMYGGLFNLAKLGRSTSSKFATDAAASKRHGGALGSLFMQLLGSEPVKAAMANLTSRISNRDADSAETGDALHHANTVREMFGDVVGDAYATGDVPALVGAIMSDGADSHYNYSTGDPVLDDHIEHSVLEEIAGDPIYSDAQVGGPLTNLRIRALKAKAARIRRRNLRKSGKQRRKDADAAALEAAKQEVQEAQAGAGYQEYSGFNPDSAEQESGQQQDGSGDGQTAEQGQGGDMPDFNSFSWA